MNERVTELEHQRYENPTEEEREALHFRWNYEHTRMRKQVAKFGKDFKQCFGMKQYTDILIGLGESWGRVNCPRAMATGRYGIDGRLRIAHQIFGI